MRNAECRVVSHSIPHSEFRIPNSRRAPTTPRRLRSRPFGQAKQSLFRADEHLPAMEDGCSREFLQAAAGDFLKLPPQLERHGRAVVRAGEKQTAGDA